MKTIATMTTIGLELGRTADPFDCAYLEVNADSCDEGGSEGVFAEAQQAARFADAAVAYEKEFDLYRHAISDLWFSKVVMRGSPGLLCVSPRRKSR